MSDVVNRRKQITKDGRGATIHDWLEEKEDEIDLEPFEWLNFLKILSQLNSEIGHFDTAGACADEIWVSTKVDSFPVFSTYFFKSDLRTLSVNMAPGSAQPRQRPSGKCGCGENTSTTSHWPDIRSGGLLQARQGSIPY